MASKRRCVCVVIMYTTGILQAHMTCAKTSMDVRKTSVGWAHRNKYHSHICARRCFKSSEGASNAFFFFSADEKLVVKSMDRQVQVQVQVHVPVHIQVPAGRSVGTIVHKRRSLRQLKPRGGSEVCVCGEGGRGGFWLHLLGESRCSSRTTHARHTHATRTPHCFFLCLCLCYLSLDIQLIPVRC